MAVPEDAGTVLTAIRLGWCLAEVRGRNRPDAPPGARAELPGPPSHSLPLHVEQSPAELRIETQSVLTVLAEELRVDRGRNARERSYTRAIDAQAKRLADARGKADTAARTAADSAAAPGGAVPADWGAPPAGTPSPDTAPAGAPPTAGAGHPAGPAAAAEPSPAVQAVPHAEGAPPGEPASHAEPTPDADATSAAGAGRPAGPAPAAEPALPAQPAPHAEPGAPAGSGPHAGSVPQAGSGAPAESGPHAGSAPHAEAAPHAEPIPHAGSVPPAGPAAAAPHAGSVPHAGPSPHAEPAPAAAGDPAAQWDALQELIFAFDQHVQDTLAAGPDAVACGYQLGRALAEPYWALDPALPKNTQSPEAWWFLLGAERCGEMSRLVGRLSAYFHPFTAAAIAGSVQIWKHVAADETWRGNARNALYQQIRRWYELVVMSQDPTTLVRPYALIRNFRMVFRALRIFWSELLVAAIAAFALSGFVVAIGQHNVNGFLKSLLGFIAIGGFSLAGLTARLKNEAQAMVKRLRQDVYTDLVAVAISTAPPVPSAPDRPAQQNAAKAQMARERTITPVTPN